MLRIAEKDVLKIESVLVRPSFQFPSVLMIVISLEWGLRSFTAATNTMFNFQYYDKVAGSPNADGLT